jgi:hypothetical protein
MGSDGPCVNHGGIALRGWRQDKGWGYQLMRLLRNGYRGYCLCALLAALPLHAHADRIAEVQAGMAYDSNLNNGEQRSDLRGDLAYRLATSQGLYLPAAEYGGATLTGDLGLQSYQRFSGMDNLSLGATLGYRSKFGLGPAAPWASVYASAARLDFKDSIRNGWQYYAGVRVGRRLDERWDVNAELRLDHRDASNGTAVVPGIPGNVFNLKGASATLNAAYAWDEKLQLAAGYGYRHGDVAATTRPGATIFFASAAIAADPVFGPDFFAYRLRASSQSASLHASQALNAHSSLNLGMQRQLTHGDGGNNYAKNLFDLTYLYSF